MSASKDERRPPGKEEAPHESSENESPSQSSSASEHGTVNGRRTSLRPPSYVVPNAGNIPAALKQIDNWVPWGYEERIDKKTGEVKVTKVPVNARTGGHASTTNSKTWTTFDRAWATYERDGLDGVGFVLTVELCIVGIDIDHCLDPETGVLDEDALSIIRDLDSYTEVSPSGTGVRIFARGTLPKGRRKHGRYEMYERARYMTVTGAHLDGSPLTIEERPEQIARVHSRFLSKAERAKGADQKATRTGSNPGGRERRHEPADEEKVLARARRGKSGQKFSALFDRGDWEGEGYTSQSEADLALCAILAWYSNGDRGLVDATFRRSALMRLKWDERHHADGRSYGKGTVDTATADRRAEPQGVGADSTPRGVLVPDVRSLLSLTHASERLMERHPHDLMWSHVGSRFVWVGSHWKEDREAVAEQWCDEVAQTYRLEADQLKALACQLVAGTTDAHVSSVLEMLFPRAEWSKPQASWENGVAGQLRKRAAELIALFKRLERPAGFMEMLGRVAAYHTQPAEKLDDKPRLLACPNGTLEMTTGELRPAERGDLITRVTAVDCVEGARSEAWDGAIAAWTDGDQTIARYLQVAFGYSLLGNPLLGRFCFLLHGPGQSGRSALLDTLAAAIGGYASSFSWRALEPRKGASHDEDLAALRGRRFAFSNEAGDKHLDAEKLKAVTSGEEQHVSRKHERAFRMRPTFVVWAATNRMPELPSDDLALWTRIRVVPFRRQFPVSSFRAELMGDAEVLRAVLAWGVAGAREYLANGLPLCPAVYAATAAAQRELNPLSAWLDDRTESVADAWTPAGALFGDYERWCRANTVAAHRRVGDRRFGVLLKALGFEPRPRNGVRGNVGIRLRAHDRGMPGS